MSTDTPQTIESHSPQAFPPTALPAASSVQYGDGLRGKLQRILESAKFQRAIIVLIVINAITLGLETSPSAMQSIGELLTFADHIILGIFCLELLAKLYVYRGQFHKDAWNIFDFIVVLIALIPAIGSLSVLRSLRVLRVLRLISSVPSMRRVVGALLSAVPGMSSVAGLLLLVFYVFAVMSTKLFGEAFPDFFGTIGRSAYSLFQVMTLESWSMGVVRPVMEVYPLAWTFFVPFILLTSFTVLNLFIGIVVDAMQQQHETDETDIAEQGRDERAEILSAIQELRSEVEKLRLSARD